MARMTVAAMLVALTLVSVTSRQTWAQSYPNKTIRVVVPYAAGGATDNFARIVATKLQEQMKVPVVIDNRAGAGGNIGTDAVARAAPDGYTVLFNINGQAISPAIYKSLPYDADKDFLRVTQLVSTATVLVVNPSVPAKTFQEFVAYAKANPGKLNYGSTGIGNSLHLTMEMLKKATGIDIQMVPFRGDAPLFTALLGGEIQAAMVPTSAAKSHIDAGAIRALGVTAAKREANLPNVPTLVEQGVPDFVVSGWMGLFVPAKTPRDIVERLWKESQTALAAPDVKPVLANLGLNPIASSPEDFDKLYFADRQKFQKIVRDANIPLQD